MSQSINFDPIRLPPEAEELRLEVREFLADEIANGSFNPSSSILKSGFDREFSKRVGKRGWIGMTWPKKYGGQERSFLERYVVTEEFRSQNAPVTCHFNEDRQSEQVQ